MTLVYRLRNTRALLDHHQELANQEIYFADPVELNDPMEGFRNIVWRGDSIVWTNLFKHYVYCLHQIFFYLKLSEHNSTWDANDIPILDCYDNPPTPQMGELFNDIWAKTRDELNLPVLAASLSDTNYDMRHNDLVDFLLLDLHTDTITNIHNAWINRNLTTPSEQNQRHSWRNEKALRRPNYPETLDQLKKERPELASGYQKTVYQTTQKLRLRHRYNFNFASDEKIPEGWQRLFLDFPNFYVSQLEKLLWPQWYTACFVRDCKNSAAWAHYGDKHKGVCLIFNPSETSNGDGLELKRRSDWMDSTKGYGEGGRASTYHFHDVNYTDVPGEIDFFGNIGTLPISVLLRQWYTDESGVKSERVTPEMGGSVWMDKHWKYFYRDIVIKGRAWEYENECRLILHGVLDNTLDKHQRILTYNFNALSGIIFGIKTSEVDKARILEIIRQKCHQNDRTEFAFFQAYFDPRTGDIKYFPVELPGF